MTITTITQEEFEVGARPSTRRSPETQAIRNAPLNTGLRMPCRWEHSKAGQCAGSQMMYQFARRHGFHLRTHCANGMLNVWKEERKLPEKAGA